MQARDGAASSSRLHCEGRGGGSRSSRRAIARVIAVALSSALGAASRAATAQANHQSYPIGERATGLGGAFTALADDAAGAWYNAAGLAFAREDSVSVSASLYGLVGANYPSSLGRGLDYDYTTLNVIPASVASLVGFGTRRRDGSRPIVVAVNVFNPSTYQIDRRVALREGATALHVSTSDRLIAAGPTVALRLSDRLGLGLAVLATLHTLYDNVDLTDLRPMSREQFVQFTSSTESLSAGLAVAAGVRFDVRPGLSVGLSARTPSVAVWGSGERFERTVRASEGAPLFVATNRASLAPARLWPAQFRMGAAWVVAERFALSIDASLSLPLRYDAFRARDGSVARPSVLRAVCNGALGVEFYPRRTLAFRAGVFSDVSAAPTPLEGDSRIDQVDQVGAALTGTWLVRGTSTTVGVVGTYGRARVVGIDVESSTYGPYAPFVTDGTQWRVYLVLGGTTRL